MREAIVEAESALAKLEAGGQDKVRFFPLLVVGSFFLSSS